MSATVINLPWLDVAEEAGEKRLEHLGRAGVDLNNQRLSPSSDRRKVTVLAKVKDERKFARQLEKQVAQHVAHARRNIEEDESA